MIRLKSVSDVEFHEQTQPKWDVELDSDDLGACRAKATVKLPPSDVLTGSFMLDCSITAMSESSASTHINKE